MIKVLKTCVVALGLIFTLTSRADPIDLVCQVDITSKQNGQTTNYQSVESGVEILEMIDGNAHYISIIPDSSLLFSVSTRSGTDRIVENYTTESKWHVKVASRHDRASAFSEIIINRYSGKITMNRLVVFSETESIEKYGQGSCTKISKHQRKF